MTEPSSLDGLRHAAEDLVGELTAALPRLIERSREQLAIVASLADRLPCGGWLGARAQSSAPGAPDLHVVETDDSDLGDVIEVSRIAPPSPTTAEGTAPTRPTPARPPAAKKAPAARTAPAKKAPAARTAPAKKAPAKKAPAARTAPAKKAPAARTAPAKKAVAGTASNALAIPDYDQLAASQVIPRLESLTRTELESVRSYEASHRARRTILGRISQLEGA